MMTHGGWERHRCASLIDTGLPWDPGSCMGSGSDPWMTASPAHSPPISPALTSSSHYLRWVSTSLPCRYRWQWVHQLQWVERPVQGCLLASAWVQSERNRRKPDGYRWSGPGWEDQLWWVYQGEYDTRDTGDTRRCIWNLEFEKKKNPEIRCHPPCFNITYSPLCGFLDHLIGFLKSTLRFCRFFMA